MDYIFTLYYKKGASRVVSEDPTYNLKIQYLKLFWFPAYSSHVYIIITINSANIITL